MAIKKMLITLSYQRLLIFVCAIITSLMLSSIPAHSQTNNFSINRLNSIDKLPVMSINMIFEDNEGYMWYGTVDGLCRDDGYDIHVFRSDFNTPGIMEINSVLGITEDSGHRIWFGTQKGVYILDKSNYKVKPLVCKELDCPVAHLLCTKDGNIWIYGNSKLHEFNKDGILKRSIPIHTYINFLFQDSKGNLFYGEASRGLYMKGADNDSFKKIDGFIDPTCMTEDVKAHKYWIAEYNDGIYSHPVDEPLSGAKRVRHPHRFNNSPGTPLWVKSIATDNASEYLWMITNNGFEVTNSNHSIATPAIGLDHLISSQKKILSGLCKTADGRIYVSGFDTESFVICPSEQKPRHYSVKALVEKTNYDPAIVTLCRDDDGIIWYYQEANGLFIYDLKSENVVSFKECPDLRDLPLYVVPYLVRSHDKNCVWVSTNNKRIMKLKRTGMTLTLVKDLDLNSYDTDTGDIEVIYEDSNRNLWIGTMKGVYAYTASDGKIHTVSDDIGDVSDFTQTNDGQIWGTVRNTGLLRISPDMRHSLFPFKMDFLTLDATSDGKLWVSSGEGQVLTFDINNPSAIEKDYTLAAGLYGDMVDHVKVDRYNHIWIITPQSIREFNPRNSALRVYSTKDRSIPLRRILPRAVWKDFAGEEILFGGIPGFVSFTGSQQLESIPRNTAVHISDVKSNGKSLLLNGNNRTQGNGINISPDEEHISIEFSSLDFRHISHIRYAYRLRNLEKDWIYLPVGENKAVYNRLSKGEYVFEVKATDENGLWSYNITQFTLNRLPAWYETWWAYLTYASLGAALLFYIMRLYLQRLNSRNDKVLLEKVTQTKLRYFTNISHELLMPLTIISVIAERLRNDSDGKAEKLDMLQRNVERLKHLLQQVLDFRKIENNKMKLFVSKGDIIDFTESICRMSFMPLAASKNIDLKIFMGKSNEEHWFDHDKMDKIMFNLVSNAIKYTDSGKSVEVSVNTETVEGLTYAEIIVKDQGRGIAQREIGRIFNRFYTSTANHASESNGIGLSLTKEFVELHHGTILVESQLGKGTSFKVRIPVSRQSFSSEEMLEERQEMQNLLLNNTSNAVTYESEEKSIVLQDAKTVLLVEDNTDLRRLIKELLMNKYNVLVAADGIEALECIEKHRNAIDIVVSDIMMPRMDGMQLCRKIKDDVTTSHYLVILLTAKVSSDIQADAYDAGADGYLPKPFEPSLLNKLIENLISNRAHRQKIYSENKQSMKVSDLGVTGIDEGFISKAISIVEKHIMDEKLDVSFLSASLAMSRSTFTRKIKILTGQTPLDFIKSIKLKHAYKMLQEKTATVQDVMEAVGYSDHKTFTQSFKEAFGILPSELLRQHRKKD